MLQPAKGATPATAATGFVSQAGVAPAGGGSASVTSRGSVVTVFPAASWTVTTGWVANGSKISASLGWAVNANCVAGPAMMVNAVLTAGVNVPSIAVTVYVPAMSMLHPAKVATPATAATGFAVHARVA